MCSQLLGLLIMELDYNMEYIVKIKQPRPQVNTYVKFRERI